MAGIGFELKKLFSKKGLFAILRAYGYAGIVCTGPMLLGIVLLLGVRILAGLGGASAHDQDLLICMITYTLLATMILSNVFSMVTTRFTADVIYSDKLSAVMPSFYGSLSLELIFGCVAYGIFLTQAGIPFSYQILCLLLFGELIVVWSEINYLTAIKDYRGILITFFVALLAALGAGYGMVVLHFQIINAMLIAVNLAYGIMMVWYYFLLVRYFPKGEGSAFVFLKWFDRNPALGAVGIFVTLGLFAHLIIMWFSPVGVRVQGLFFGAPQYDVPALFAFLSILVTTVNFVTSVEVNFYPKYRNYFSLFNEGGSLMDIKQAELEMKVTLYKELSYTFTKQFFSTVAFIIVGTILLPRLPLGFNDEMLGIYRVLCVGYAFYAIGNSTMLISLYFSDAKSAFRSSLFFFLFSTAFTILLSSGSIQYYGFGFLIGGIAFSFISIIRLLLYLRNLTYYVLASQPIVAAVKRGFLTKWSEKLEQRYDKKYGREETI